MLRRQLIHQSRNRLLAKTPLLPPVFSSSSISSSAAPTIIIHSRTSFSSSKLLLTEENSITSKPNTSSSKKVVIKAVSSILVDGANFLPISFNTIAFELLKESIQKYLESKLREAYEEDNPDENCSGLKVRVIFPPSSLHVVFPDPVDGLDKQAIDETEFIKRLKFHRELESAGWIITLAKYKKTETSKWKAIEDDVVLANKASEISRQGYFAPIGASSKRATAEHLFIVTGDGDHLSTVKDANSNNDENSEHHSEKRALRYVVLSTKRKSSSALIRYGESVDRIHRLYDDEEYDRAIDELLINQPVSRRRDREPKSGEKRPEQVLQTRKEAVAVSKEEPNTEIAKEEPKPEIVAKPKSSSSVASSILELLESEEETSKEQQHNTSIKSSLAAIVEDEPPTTPVKSNQPTPPVAPAPPARSSSLKEKESSSSLPFSLKEAANYYLNPHVTKPARAMKLEALAPSFHENGICFDDKTKVGCRRKNCTFVHPSRGETRLGDKLCKGDEDHVKSGKRSTCMCKYVHRSRGEKTLTGLEEERKKQTEEKKEEQPNGENNNNNKDYLCVDLARHAPFYNKPHVAENLKDRKIQLLDPRNPKNVLCEVQLAGRKCRGCQFVHQGYKNASRVGDLVCKRTNDTTCPCPFVHRIRGEKTLSELETEESKKPITSGRINSGEVALLDGILRFELADTASFYLDSRIVSAAERAEKKKSLDCSNAQNSVCPSEASKNGCMRHGCGFMHPSRGEVRRGDKLCPLDVQFQEKGTQSKCTCPLVHRSRGEKTLKELEEDGQKERESQTTDHPHQQVGNERSSSMNSTLAFEIADVAPSFLNNPNKNAVDAKKQMLDPKHPGNALCDCDDLSCNHVHLHRGQVREGDFLCRKIPARQAKCMCKRVHPVRGEKTLTELEKERADKQRSSRDIPETFLRVDLARHAPFYNHREMSEEFRQKKMKVLDPTNRKNILCEADCRGVKCLKVANCNYVHPLTLKGNRIGDLICKSDQKSSKMSKTSKCPCPYVHRTRGEKTLSELEKEESKMPITSKSVEANLIQPLMKDGKVLGLEDAAAFYLTKRVSAAEKRAKMKTLDRACGSNQICANDKITGGCRKNSCTFVHPSRGEERIGDKLCPTDVHFHKRGQESKCRCKYVHRSRGEKTLTELEIEQELEAEANAQGETSSLLLLDDSASNEEKKFFDIDEVAPFYKNRAMLVRRAKEKMLDPTVHANILCKCKLANCAFVHQHRGQKRAGDRVCPADQNFTRRNQKSNCPCKFVHPSRREKTLTELEEERAEKQQTALLKTSSPSAAASEASSTTKDLWEAAVERTAKVKQSAQEQQETLANNTSLHQDVISFAPSPSPSSPFEIQRVASFYVLPGVPKRVRQEKRQALDPQNPKNKFCHNDKRCTDNSCMFVHPSKGEQRAGDLICDNDVYNQEKGLSSKCRCPKVHRSRNEKTLTELEEEIETQKQDRIRDPNHTKNMVCRYDHQPGGCSRPDCHFAHPKSKGEERAGDIICPNESNLGKDEISSCPCSFVHRTRGEKTLTETESLYSPSTIVEVILTSVEGDRVLERINVSYSSLPHIFKIRYARGETIYVCSNYYNFGDCAWAKCCYLHITREDAEEGKLVVESNNSSISSIDNGNAPLSHDKLVTVVYTGDGESGNNNNTVRYFTVPLWSLSKDARVRHNLNERLEICTHYFNTGECPHRDCKFIHMSLKGSDEKNGTPSLTSSAKEKVGRPTVINTSNDDDRIAQRKAEAFLAGKAVSVALPGSRSPGQDFDSKSRIIRHIPVPFSELPPHCQSRFLNEKPITACHQFYHTGECLDRKCSYLHIKTAIEQNDEVEKELIFLASNLDKRSLVKVHENIFKVKD